MCVEQSDLFSVKYVPGKQFSFQDVILQKKKTLRFMWSPSQGITGMFEPLKSPAKKVTNCKCMRSLIYHQEFDYRNKQMKTEILSPVFSLT